jgi:hypothetical protein
MRIVLARGWVHLCWWPLIFKNTRTKINQLPFLAAFNSFGDGKLLDNEPGNI